MPMTGPVAIPCAFDGEADEIDKRSRRRVVLKQRGGGGVRFGTNSAAHLPGWTGLKFKLSQAYPKQRFPRPALPIRQALARVGL